MNTFGKQPSETLFTRFLETEHKLHALIREARNRDTLLQNSCELLQAELDASYIWIYHTDRAGKPRLFISTSRTTAQQLFAQVLQVSRPVFCLANVRKSNVQILTSNQLEVCQGCPLAPELAAYTTLCGPVSHNEHVFAYFAIALKQAYFNNDWHVESLVKTIAADLGRALHILNLEKVSKITKATLFDNQMNFVHLFDTYAANILIIDPRSGQIIYANRSAVSFYGWSLERLKTMKIQDINTLSDAEVRREMQHAHTTRRTYFEFRHRRADGSSRDVEVFSNRIPWGRDDALLSIVHDTSEKQQALKMLKEAEAHYRLIFNAGEDALYIHQFQEKGFGRILQVNAAATSMLGYSQEEFLQMTPADFSEAADIMKRDAKKQRKKLFVQHEEAYEAVQIHKDGSHIPVEIKSTLIPYYGKQAILSVVRNIKERQEVERNLKNSQVNLTSLIDARDDLIWSVDVDYCFIVFNQTMQKAYSKAFHRQVKPGSDSLAFLPEEIQRYWQEKYDTVLAGKQLEFEYEYLFTHQNVILAVTMNPIMDGKHIRGVACIGSDISRTIHLYRRLIETEESMQLAFETSPDAITISQLADGKFISVNAAFTRITGYSKAEAIGKTALELKIWHNPKDRRWIGRLLYEKKYVNNYEVSFQLKSGKVIIGLLSARILELNGIPHMLSVTRDISDRIEMEEALRQLNQELEQRVKQRTMELEAALSELQSFSYSISHDLRAPLRAISGFSTILKEEYHDQLDQEGHRLLKIIRQNSERMAHLISDLLSFSRFSRMPMKYDAIDMEQLVADVSRELLESSESNLELTVGSLPTAYGDRKLIYQVWMNLLDNAIKFSRAETHPRVEISGVRKGDAVQYQVKDNGCGYDPQFAHKLFHVFQRLHRETEYEGTGIGLSIVQRIIQRHKGFVWSQATQGEGATFYFTLSATNAHAPSGDTLISVRDQTPD